MIIENVGAIVTGGASGLGGATATRLAKAGAKVAIFDLNAELGEGSVVRIEVRGPAAPSWKHGIRSVRDGRGPRDTYG